MTFSDLILMSKYGLVGRSKQLLGLIVLLGKSVNLLFVNGALLHMLRCLDISLFLLVGNSCGMFSIDTCEVLLSLR